MTTSRAGLRIEIQGIVQGVGFRPWVYRLAREGGITGWVRNDSTGVTIEAFGTQQALDAFQHCLHDAPPPAARVREMRSVAIAPDASSEFTILKSEEAVERRVSIPPDLATCTDCLADVADPSNRRYRYPFTNCTNCGPRFTIARDVPYDRAATTMAPFVMCPACRHEYESAGDRRFHAQPNACPSCGPRLAAVLADGSAAGEGDPIRLAARALSGGLIVALKGLGGFHLACDATSPAAVRELRARKRRDEKPFAVMVRNLAAADQVADLGLEERRLLQSVERPIVLATQRPGGGLAPEVAPGNPMVGLLLPYTPLHQLLLAEVESPLVMTSGNLSEEPLAYRNEEALDRLSSIADLFLVHDREIEAPCDDSVARVIAGRPVVFRRARGYVPRPVAVGRAFARPVLACGALLKNTFCVGLGSAAFLGPHMGDLENLETYASFENAIERMERFLRVRPEVIAYDLHPDYLSSSYALARPELVKVGVQHHHAHIASAMAEHGLEGPVIGVAYDGAGYGLDGTAWGGEILVATYRDFERVATFRPIALAGGDATVRQPWRTALALLTDAFADGPPLDGFPLFRAVPAQNLRVVAEMIAKRVRTPLAHGVGRYFDGVGALVLNRMASNYEGQIALEWNMAADPRERGCYTYQIDDQAAPWVVDLRPTVRAVVGDVLAGRSAATISARFHNTLAEATAALVRTVAGARGRCPVVLTGGCFQNARLTEAVLAGLTPDFAVALHHEVPPGDGGIALGQALVADARAREA
jgi:hydrogenase maturation protein HypF